MAIQNQFDVLEFGEESVTNLTPTDGQHAGQIFCVVYAKGNKTVHEAQERPPSELPLSQDLDKDEKAVPEMDREVVYHEQRPEYLYDTMSRAVIGEMHAWYCPPMTPWSQEFVNYQQRSVLKSSNDATTAPLKRISPCKGLEIMDSSIRFISSEKVDIKTLRARERKFEDDEDDMSVSSWRKYICCGSCLSKVKSTGKKTSLLERLRKCFGRQ